MNLKFIILAAALCAVPALSFASGCSLPPQANDHATAMIQSINAKRAAARRSGYRFSSHLSRIAQAHACDSAARNEMSHVGSNGSSLAQRLTAGGYPYITANENLAYTTPGRDVVQSWMDSPGHRVNVLSKDMQEVGLGMAVAQDGKNVFWVMVSALPGEFVDPKADQDTGFRWGGRVRLR